MNEAVLEQEQIICPAIVFKLQGGFYCVDSVDVTTIMQLPAYQTLPDAPTSIMGVFTYRGQAVPLLDLRSVFNMPTLREEYDSFKDMLEMRKQDHVQWVTQLKHCVSTGEKFTLATDPHQCAFGKWYDGYQSENHSINYHLRKIEEPHRNLHQAAIDVQLCTQKCDQCERKECLKNVLGRLEDQYMPQILKLLDETKDLFGSTYHEMVLLLGTDKLVGVVVDEVLFVENLTDISEAGSSDALRRNHLVRAIKRSKNIPEPILELDDKALQGLDRSTAI